MVVTEVVAMQMVKVKEEILLARRQRMLLLRHCGKCDSSGGGNGGTMEDWRRQR